MKLYFGFGANRDAAMIRAITRSSALRIPASLDGFQLCVQALCDIPEKARRVLTKKWGHDFVSYGIVAAPKSSVTGSLWLLTNAQRDAIRRWEFVDQWSQSIQVQVKINVLGLSITVNAETEHISHQKAEPVDGQNYQTFIVPKEKILRIAREVCA